MHENKVAVAESRTIFFVGLCEKVLRLAQNSNTARVKKLVLCEDSHAQELSRAGHREYLREDSDSSRENVQSRVKIFSSRAKSNRDRAKKEDSGGAFARRGIFSRDTQRILARRF